MEQLGELEKRVLDIVQKNKELFDKNSKLQVENKKLREQICQFEASLLKESSSAKSLETEKASIKSTIDDLIDTINSLDERE